MNGDSYMMQVQLKDGPLAGQVRDVRVYWDHNRPPEFVQFPELLPLPDFTKPLPPMTTSVRLHTYKSTLWRKGWNEWYEWTYVEEI